MKRKIFFMAILLFSFILPQPGNSQNLSKIENRSKERVELEASFMQKYGKQWHVFWHEDRNAVKSLRGEYDLEKTLDNATAKITAGEFLKSIDYLLNVKTEDLKYLLTDYDGFLGRYKVVFRQEYKGIKVIGGELAVFISENGIIYDFENATFPNLEIDISPIIPKNAVISIIQSKFDFEFLRIETPAISLKILPPDRFFINDFYLVYEVIYKDQTFFIDSKRGEIVHHRKNYVEDEHYYGKIQGETFPINDPDGNSLKASLPFVLVWLDESQPGNTNYDGITNNSGDYSIISPSDALTFYTRIDAGQNKFRVFDNTNPGIEHLHYYNLNEKQYNYTFPSSPGHQANIYYHLTRIWDFFKNTYSFSRPYIKACANDPGVSGAGYCAWDGTELHFSLGGGKGSCSIQHEYVHAIVHARKEGWLGDSEPIWAMNESFCMYYPCLSNNSQFYRYSNEVNRSGKPHVFDLASNTGWSYVRDWDENGVINEIDHFDYENRVPIAAAWWELKDQISDFNNFLWQVLDVIPLTEYTPRDFFNKMLVIDDDNSNPFDLTPHFNLINEAYKNHGMNYYPRVQGVNQSGNVKEFFVVGEDIYCKGWDLPTNQRVDIYVVQHNDNWVDGTPLVDISGGFETIITNEKGELPATLIWPGSSVNSYGHYDIIIDVAQLTRNGLIINGKSDFDFNGIIDAHNEIIISTNSAAQNSPYPLHMPFQSGTTWQVGGSGNFYGEGEHTNTNNEFYATDWNRVGGDDFGQPVYPVAHGKVTDTGYNANYGNYIDIVHSLADYPPFGTIKTRYAHLNSIKVGVGDVAYLDTQIGTVGKTGNATDSHLHLSFQIFNGSRYVSMSGTAPSSQPSPMVARSGSKNILWELKDGDAKTVAPKLFFNDVPNGFWAKSWTDAAYAWGVMEPYPKGQQTHFSPDVPVDRAYAAYYWIKAYHGPDYTPPPATGNVFNDVPASHWAAAYIEQAYRDGFVTGTSTNPPLYSPDRILKRAEMAVFILRALHGTSYYPPAPIGIFEDCPLDYWGSKWAEQLYKEGITSGCCSSPLQFCPENPVTRAEIAVFLLRSFNIYPKSIGGAGVADSPEVPTTWQGNLVVKDVGNANAALTFGQAPSASDGLDSTFREIELPPVPPTGTFDARFELPVLPFVSSLIDYRTDKQATTTWKMKFQPGSAGYPMTFKWNIAELPPGDFILKDAVTGNIVAANMKSMDSLVIPLSAINQMVIEKTSMLSRAVSINPGWNMISVPVAAQDMHYKSLFPNAVSSAYGYANGYVTADLLKNGFGYWLKFNDAVNYNISGFRIMDREIAVQAGWNMIGPLESDVAIANITSVPSGIVQSNYFGFDNGYRATTLLQVGKGYWVKASQAGKLKLPGTSALSKSESAVMTTDEIESKFSNWTQIKLVTNNGQSALLYLAPQSESDGWFELPPVPPTGIFDARFSSGSYVESLNHSHVEMLIQSAQYPIKLKVRNLGDFALNVKDGRDGTSFDQTLSEGQEVWLKKHLTRLILTQTPSVATTLPERYELSQNYPNPFNPTSVISYALPEAGQVRISVYNILGKNVADLVDELQPAGYHQIDIDARNYASGIYYYVMKARGFSAIKKMAIVK